MQASATPTASDDVRGFIQEYFDVWKGTDEQKILAYYSEDVVLDLPMGTVKGKTAVRDNFVRPFIAGAHSPFALPEFLGPLGVSPPRMKPPSTIC